MPLKGEQDAENGGALDQTERQKKCRVAKGYSALISTREQHIQEALAYNLYRRPKTMLAMV